MLHLLALVVSAAVMAGPSNRTVPVPAPKLTEAEITHMLEAPERRVRAFAPHLRRGVAEGLRRSATFASLLQLIEASDVIVQIVESHHLPVSTPARMSLTTTAGEFRFLRIEVGFHRAGDELITLLGHELQHAVEVAINPQVRDARALAALYSRIGFRTSSERQFDTYDAHTVERRIRRELWESTLGVDS